MWRQRVEVEGVRPNCTANFTFTMIQRVGGCFDGIWWAAGLFLDLLQCPHLWHNEWRIRTDIVVSNLHLTQLWLPCLKHQHVRKASLDSVRKQPLDNVTFAPYAPEVVIKCHLEILGQTVDLARPSRHFTRNSGDCDVEHSHDLQVLRLTTSWGTEWNGMMSDNRGVLPPVNYVEYVFRNVLKVKLEDPWIL